MADPEQSRSHQVADQSMEDAPNGFAEASGLPDAATSLEPFDSSTGDGDADFEDGNSETFADDDGFLRSLQRKNLLPTGCCYDDRMKLHANADFGPTPHHPEDPRRIEEIMKLMKKAGLVYTGKDTDLLTILKETPTKYMWRIPAREATASEICTVHTPQHLRWVEELREMDTQNLRILSREMDQGRASIYVGAMSCEAAHISAGGTIETCKNVVSGQVKNAIAIVRPPGHHAEFDQPMGFCLFNNVPVAAKVCQLEYPETCRKILILDWDVHHGNGIQNIFYEDPNVLYISIHVWADGAFYPGKEENSQIPDGDIDKVGTGVGIGRNINIGWHAQGMGDGEYLAAFQKIVMPISKEFNPDLVIVSAGFDAADGDELGGCFVTPACYAHMTHMLMSLAGGKVAVCLEGGYNLRAISQSALAVARTLMGEPPPQMRIPPINKEASRTLAKVQAIQAPYWECMRPGVVNVRGVGNDSSRLHDVVRGYQRQVFADQHSMIPLFIQREVLFKSFENQVLVSPGIYNKKKILLIIHDPPELVAMPDLIDNSVDAHNAFVLDGVTRYVDWASKQGFGVLDVNVPHYITHPEDIDSFTPRADERSMHNQIQELVCFIWDNYLQLYDSAEDIFLMGVGNAYMGVKLLLTSRDCRSRISGVVNFVTGNLKPVKSDVDQELSSWYRNNSLVYVANDHACWSDPVLAKKVQKKRFGGVKRSPARSLNSMMEADARDVQEWIIQRTRSDNSGDSTEYERMT